MRCLVPALLFNGLVLSLQYSDISQHLFGVFGGRRFGWRVWEGPEHIFLNLALSLDFFSKPTYCTFKKPVILVLLWFIASFFKGHTAGCIVFSRALCLSTHPFHKPQSEVSPVRVGYKSPLSNFLSL